MDPFAYILPPETAQIHCGATGLALFRRPYVSTKKDGSERLNFTAFYEALLEAKGVDLGGSGKVGKGGRKLSYVATVQGNGNLLVGKAYTAMLDLKPGDEFEIKLGRKQVRLIPVGGVDEEE